MRVEYFSLTTEQMNFCIEHAHEVEFYRCKETKIKYLIIPEYLVSKFKAI
jgi:hypothetical protein